MQPDSASLIGQECVYPKAPVPTQQKWKLLPVSYRDQNKVTSISCLQKRRKLVIENMGYAKILSSTEKYLSEY